MLGELDGHEKAFILLNNCLWPIIFILQIFEHSQHLKEQIRNRTHYHKTQSKPSTTDRLIALPILALSGIVRLSITVRIRRMLYQLVSILAAVVATLDMTLRYWYMRQ